MSGTRTSPAWTLAQQRHGRILIGTAGWNYRHWLGPFYPKGTRTRQMLSHYASIFPTVEINNTFYSLPSFKILESWKTAAPQGFVFSCKANRRITHSKKLKDPSDTLPTYFEAVETLGDKLGPHLVQLPPRWRLNVERLRSFLEAAAKGRRLAFEFRDHSWYCEAVNDALRAHGACLCEFELDGWHSPKLVTADFHYMRLHGPGAAYEGSYDDKALAAWAAEIVDLRDRHIDLYCYFDNDEKGYAPLNAERLAGMLASRLKLM